MLKNWDSFLFLRARPHKEFTSRLVLRTSSVVGFVIPSVPGRDSTLKIKSSHPLSPSLLPPINMIKYSLNQRLEYPIQLLHLLVLRNLSEKPTLVTVSA